MSGPFNPLAMDSLAYSIVDAMMKMDPVPLDNVPRFAGAGIYALYYCGNFGAYSALVQTASDETVPTRAVPIYVGKAVPAGGRKGVDAAPTKTQALSNRIREHAGSVRAATNLDIADFHARWLVIEDIWIPLGESALLRQYRPVWNVMLDGFGNHDPGKGRINGVRPRWDTLHPGRPWAVKYPERDETPEEIEQDIVEYLRSRSA